VNPLQQSKAIAKKWAFAGIIIGAIFFLHFIVDHNFNIYQSLYNTRASSANYDQPFLPALIATLQAITTPGLILFVFSIGHDHWLNWVIWILLILINWPIYYCVGFVYSKIRTIFNDMDPFSE